MKLFVCIYDDCRLLPHFLEHYAAYGVTEFHIAAPPQMESFVDGVSSRYRVRQYNEFDVADSFLGGAAAVTAMRNRAHEADEFAVIVDLDEFLEADDPLPRIVEMIKGEGANLARGIMIDRFALDGQPKGFDENSVLPELFPVAARFTKEVMRGNDKKGFIVRGDVKSLNAHHKFHDEMVYSDTFNLAHYKWNDRALERVRAAYNMLTEAQRPWAKEFKAVLTHYETYGRFAWETFGGKVVGKVESPSAAGV